MPGPWRRDVSPALPERAYAVPDEIPYGEVYFFSKGEYIGTGATSFVDKLVSGDVVKYPKPNPYCPEKESRCRQQLEVEAQAYTRIGLNPRLPRLVSWDASSGCLVLQYLANGDLASYLKQKQTTAMQRQTWMAQAEEALTAVHSAVIIHCDVTPRNFMLDDALNLCIADFAGCSISGSPSTIDVSPRFQRPGRGRNPTCEGDIFALGSVLYHIETGTEPYHDVPEKEAQGRFHAGVFPPTATLNCGSIIHGCWTGEWENAQQIATTLDRCSPHPCD